MGSQLYPVGEGKYDQVTQPWGKGVHYQEGLVYKAWLMIEGWGKLVQNINTHYKVEPRISNDILEVGEL